MDEDEATLPIEAPLDRLEAEIATATGLTDEQLSDLYARIADPGPFATGAEVDALFNQLLGQNSEP